MVASLSLHPFIREVPLMKLRISSAAILVIGLITCTSAFSKNQPWSYSGPSGPEHWADLSPDYALCSSGREQSPINIEEVAIAQLPALETHYVTGPATLRHKGHTLEVRSDIENRLLLGADTYEFVQMHFHAPGEEQIKGRSYPLSAHLVHSNQNGELAVITILFKEGAENPVLAPVLAAIPARKSEVLTLGRLNIADLFPAQRDYYAYMGSLTVPPCTEGVRWQVLKTPVEVSKAQLQTFQLLFPANARPVQPTNTRTVQVGG